MWHWLWGHHLDEGLSAIWPILRNGINRVNEITFSLWNCAPVCFQDWDIWGKAVDRVDKDLQLCPSVVLSSCSFFPGNSRFKVDMIENLPHTWEQYPIHSVGNYFQKHSQLSFLSVCRLRPKKTVVFLDVYIAWENNRRQVCRCLTDSTVVRGSVRAGFVFANSVI